MASLRSPADDVTAGADAGKRAYGLISPYARRLVYEHLTFEDILKTKVAHSPRLRPSAGPVWGSNPWLPQSSVALYLLS